MVSLEQALAAAAVVAAAVAAAFSAEEKDSGMSSFKMEVTLLLIE